MIKNADTDKYKYQGHGIEFDLSGIELNRIWNRIE